MRYAHRGFTLMELMVTAGIVLIVMSLLAYPIFSAYGYIRKAQARTDAKMAADAVEQRLKNELTTAPFIFDMPYDGSMITLVEGTDGNTLDTSGQVKLVRYAQVLDFPWTTGGPPWTLLSPNYTGLNPSYNTFYNPFWYTNGNQKPWNPYVLARYASPAAIPWNDGSAGDALHIGINGRYPMESWTSVAGLPKEILQRQMRNSMVSVTPVGDKWDVPQFQATPLRVNTETLSMVTDSQGRKVPTAVLARFPMWGGRNLNLDEVVTSELTKYYAAADLSNIATDFPLYPVTVNHGVDVNMNPFGYRMRVFSGDGAILAGPNVQNSATPSQFTQLLVQRHYMDWPPIDRPDWNTTIPLWAKADIDRQRLEGKVVFAQPMRATSLTLTAPDTNNTSTATLPIPTVTAPGVTGWTDSATYLVDIPRTITMQLNTGSPLTFRRVATAADLAEGTFYVPYFEKTGWTADNTSRVVKFMSASLASGSWSIVNTQGYLQYTICDLQASDNVVASYATKGVLDILLTVSRQDNTGGSARQRRQDYTAKFRVTAENAIIQARSSR